MHTVFGALVVVHFFIVSFMAGGAMKQMEILYSTKIPALQSTSARATNSTGGIRAEKVPSRIKQPS